MCYRLIPGIERSKIIPLCGSKFSKVELYFLSRQQEPTTIGGGPNLERMGIASVDYFRSSFGLVYSGLLIELVRYKLHTNHRKEISAGRIFSPHEPFIVNLVCNECRVID